MMNNDIQHKIKWNNKWSNEHLLRYAALHQTGELVKPMKAPDPHNDRRAEPARSGKGRKHIIFMRNRNQTSVCQDQYNEPLFFSSWLKSSGMQHLCGRQTLECIIILLQCSVGSPSPWRITCRIWNRFHNLIFLVKLLSVFKTYVLKPQLSVYCCAKNKTTHKTNLCSHHSFYLIFPEWIYFGSALRGNTLCQQHRLATRWLHIMWALYSSACSRLSGWPLVKGKMLMS